MMNKLFFCTVFSVCCLVFGFTINLYAVDNVGSGTVNVVKNPVDVGSGTVKVVKKPVDVVRETAVAGRFYDSDADVLRDKIKVLLKVKTKVEVEDKPIALIVPHAGYMYSGLVAAHGYSSLKKHKYKRVIIVGPSHTKRFRGASIGAFTHYKTPLGLLEVDRKVCDKLLMKPKALTKREFWPFGTMEPSHVAEHAIETQLPFLQFLLEDDFKIVPILLGFLKNEDYDEIAKQLKLLINKDTLIVISSDFMHYGTSYGYTPFKNNIEENITKYDYKAFESIVAVDFNQFRSYKMQTGSNICGANPIAVLLKTLPRNSKGKLIAYDTSGKQTDNFTYSVSYASLAFTLTHKKNK